MCPVKSFLVAWSSSSSLYINYQVTHLLDVLGFYFHDALLTRPTTTGRSPQGAARLLTKLIADGGGVCSINSLMKPGKAKVKFFFPLLLWGRLVRGDYGLSVHHQEPRLEPQRGLKRNIDKTPTHRHVVTERSS